MVCKLSVSKSKQNAARGVLAMSFRRAKVGVATRAVLYLSVIDSCVYEILKLHALSLSSSFCSVLASEVNVDS